MKNDYLWLLRVCIDVKLERHIFQSFHSKHSNKATKLQGDTGYGKNMIMEKEQ